MANTNRRRKSRDNSKKQVDSFEYEVFGRVQKVGFRVMMYKKLQEFNGDVSGSAMNTSSGTVRGELFGSKANLEKMKLWLSLTGSPRSRIDSCRITNERQNVEREIVGYKHNRKLPLWCSPDTCCSCNII